MLRNLLKPSKTCNDNIKIDVCIFAHAIVENLEDALEQFKGIYEDLEKK